MELDISHAPAMADIHHKSFKGFFLTSLGKKFLSNFYTALISASDGICNGIFVNNTLVGFATGTTNVSGFYTRILKSGFLKLAIAAAPALLVKPRRIFMLLSSLRKSGHNLDKPSGSLLSICILPEYQGMGLGKTIIDEFEQLSKQRNVSSIVLTTDATNNTGANQFYLRAGYRLIHKIEGNSGRKMNLYKKDL